MGHHQNPLGLVALAAPAVSRPAVADSFRLNAVTAAAGTGPAVVEALADIVAAAEPVVELAEPADFARLAQKSN